MGNQVGLPFFIKKNLLLFSLPLTLKTNSNFESRLLKVSENTAYFECIPFQLFGSFSLDDLKLDEKEFFSSNPLFSFQGKAFSSDDELYFSKKNANLKNLTCFSAHSRNRNLFLSLKAKEVLLKNRVLSVNQKKNILSFGFFNQRYSFFKQHQHSTSRFHSKKVKFLTPITKTTSSLGFLNRIFFKGNVILKKGFKRKTLKYYYSKNKYFYSSPLLKV